MNILSDLDFLQASKIIAAMIDPVASDPGTPVESQLWYNTTLERFKSYDGSSSFIIPRIDDAETVTGVWTWNPDSGSVPFVVDASHNSVVTNLNADLLDGYHASSAASADTIALRGGAGSLLVATPTLDSHAATKAYVDAVAAGNDWKGSCLVATTSALPAYSHSSGVLTADTNGAIGSIDGVALSLSDRVLVKDESGANAPYNGIYEVTVVGDLSNPWELSRASDANVDAEVTSGLTTYIEGGSTNAGAGYTLTTADPITLGTTDLEFSQTSGSSILTAGNGLVKSGSEFHFAQSGSYSIGQIPYASGTTTIGFINAATSGNVLKSNGAAIPTWGKVDLTTDVSGVLPLANGGTGSSSVPTAGAVIYSNGSALSSDTSGLRFNSTDNSLAINVGGGYADNTLTVDGTADFTGNVGIKEDSPDVALHIKDSAAEMLKLESSSVSGDVVLSMFQTTTERFTLRYDHSETAVDFDTTGFYTFSTGGTRVASLTSSGFLALNRTTDASHPLHVWGAGSNRTAVFRNDDSTSDDVLIGLVSGTAGDAEIRFGDSNDNTQAWIRWENDTNYLVFGATDTQVGFMNNGGLTLTTLNSGSSDSVVVELSGTLRKRTIDSRVWGSTLVDASSGSANALARFTDSNTITASLIDDDGTNIDINTGIDDWITIGPTTMKFARYTEFGYSNTYDVLQIGEVGSNVALALGVDVSANPNSSFGGSEVIFPQNRNIIAPNNADDGYIGLFAVDSSDDVHIGAATFDVKSGGMIRLDTSTGDIFLSGDIGTGSVTASPSAALDIGGGLRIRTILEASGQNDVLVNDGGGGHVRYQTIDSRVWGSTLVDASGASAGHLPKFSDGNSLANSPVSDDTINVNIGSRHLALDGDYIIKGGFGARITTGTLDWNNSAHSRSGSSETLLLADATNGPGDIDGSEYFHPFTFEYDANDGSGNRTQFAIPYNKSRFYFRRYNSSAWSSWEHIWTEGYMGAGTGLDADLLDGEEGSYYLDLANSTGDTDDITEGSSNLFHTDARARASISSSDSAEIAYNSSTGVLGLGTEAGRVKSGTIGDGAATSIAFSHNLGTRDVIVQVYRTGSPYDSILADVTRNTTNQVTIAFATAPSSNEFTVVVTSANG